MKKKKVRKSNETNLCWYKLPSKWHLRDFFFDKTKKTRTVQEPSSFYPGSALSYVYCGISPGRVDEGYIFFLWKPSLSGKVEAKVEVTWIISLSPWFYCSFLINCLTTGEEGNSNF